MFIDALEASEKAQINKPSAPSIPVLKDLDEIRKLVARKLPSPFGICDILAINTDKSS